MLIYDYLRKHWKDRTDCCILEVGAHIGTDTVKLARYTAMGQLICFEPDPRNIEDLKILQSKARFRLVEKAVGNCSGVVPFYQSFGRKPGIDREITDSSSIKNPIGFKSRPWLTFKTINVEITTLDRYCAENNVSGIDLLWADVQGAELDLVSGAQETLRHTRLFYFECMSAVQMYKGQPAFKDVENALPKDTKWSVDLWTKTDVLLRRK